MFDAYPLVSEDNQFKVVMNDSIFYLDNKGECLIYQTWEEHIKGVYIITDSSNPLRKNKADNGIIVKDLNYDELSFVVLEVNEEWIYVECNSDCEGCPKSNNSVKGWLKWKDKNTLIVILRYMC